MLYGVEQKQKLVCIATMDLEKVHDALKLQAIACQSVVEQYQGMCVRYYE
jgi:hypothetical protein